jgi:hypothetical protein
MRANPTVTKLVLARQNAAAGVDFSSRHGAKCPWCGKRAKIVATRQWEDTTRIRYHRCETATCPLCSMDVGIKSIEVEK